MKKIMILALAFISLNAMAQEKRGDNNRQDKKEMRMPGSDFTPEQQATIQTKKMVLSLDLTSSQQKEVYNLTLNQEKEKQANREAFKKAKESGVKPTQQERYDNMIARLDNQIIMKTKMKSILKSEQYTAWIKNMENRPNGRKDRGGKKENDRNDNERRG
ncbi:hypothetical protein [uncultured Formosa sp.]|uniref:hypothetical protein n=1 Tax=uncultured Formosa sp. TaxID=255435 RepID=UPI0026051F5B|nr:hypothetical protein [uncultured Formosa sp.]